MFAEHSTATKFFALAFSGIIRSREGENHFSKSNCRQQVHQYQTYPRGVNAIRFYENQVVAWKGFF